MRTRMSGGVRGGAGDPLSLLNTQGRKGEASVSRMLRPLLVLRDAWPLVLAGYPGVMVGGGGGVSVGGGSGVGGTGVSGTGVSVGGGTGVFVAGAGPAPLSDRDVGVGSGGGGTSHWRASSRPAPVR